MDEIFNGKSIKVDFEAQVAVALMIQSNAFIPLKLAVPYVAFPSTKC